jgi:hypothetical protein
VSARQSGVVTFAGVLFLVAGVFNAIDGVVALAEPRHFYISEGKLVVDNFELFGIVLLVVAGLEFFVGWGVLARVRAAQVIGIILAIIAVVVHFAHFTAYPAWAVIVLVLNAVIIYALTVHGDEFAPARR